MPPLSVAMNCSSEFEAWTLSTTTAAPGAMLSVRLVAAPPSTDSLMSAAPAARVDRRARRPGRRRRRRSAPRCPSRARRSGSASGTACGDGAADLDAGRLLARRRLEPAMTSASAAERARSIGPSFDSLICTPDSESFFTSTPRIVPLAICVRRDARGGVRRAAKREDQRERRRDVRVGEPRRPQPHGRSPFPVGGAPSVVPPPARSSTPNGTFTRHGAARSAPRRALGAAVHCRPMADGTPGDDRWWRDFDGFVLGLRRRPVPHPRRRQRRRQPGPAARARPGTRSSASTRTPSTSSRSAPASRSSSRPRSAASTWSARRWRSTTSTSAAPSTRSRRCWSPTGSFVVNEFDWPAYDARAAAWVDEPESSDPVEQWATEHDDLHSRSAMLRGASAAASRSARSCRDRTSRAWCAARSASRTSAPRSRPGACRRSASGSSPRSRQRPRPAALSSARRRSGRTRRSGRSAPSAARTAASTRWWPATRQAKRLTKAAMPSQYPCRDVGGGTACRTPRCACVKARDSRSSP